MANRRLAIYFFFSAIVFVVCPIGIFVKTDPLVLLQELLCTMCGQPQPTRGQREPDINEKQSRLNCRVQRITDV
jgi:hypothetical protein